MGQFSEVWGGERFGVQGWGRSAGMGARGEGTVRVERREEGGEGAGKTR